MRRGLGRQLYVWFVVSVTAPLILVAIAATLLVNSQLQGARVGDITNALVPTAHRIENALTELERITFSPYLHHDLFTLLTYADRGYLADPPKGMATTVARAERTYTNTLVKMMFTADQTVRSITFYPASGDDDLGHALVRTTPGLREVAAPGYRSTPWYEAAALDGSFVTISAEPAPVVTLATMIRDLDRDRHVGVLVVEADADELLAGVANLTVRASDTLVLADSAGRVLAGTGGEWDADDAGYVPIEVAIPSVGWRLVYQVSKSDVRASTAVLVGLGVAAALVTSAAAFGIYRRESRTVVRGSSDILDTLHSMRAGDLSKKSTVTSDDWLGTIAESVNHLGSELSSLIDREYKAVIDRQNAEYRALQAQISPHFLYNVFNDFMAMNRLGQRERLEESILRMTRLLRYSCSTAEFATVRDEVEFAREYLYLRQIQLDERLSYEIEMDEGCAEVTMPRLIIQPLVENAIKHGLSDERPLVVQLRVEQVEGGGRARVTIRDDGNGFDADRITESTGFATMNIRERLRILSEDAVLDITSHPGHGTTCVLDLRSEQLCGS